MIDENGQDLNWTPEPRKMVTAVLPHPIHGRLVEKIMLMINSTICFKGCFYKLTWREGDVCFYEPAFAAAEICCAC
jgi:hypothetical protein